MAAIRLKNKEGVKAIESRITKTLNELYELLEQTAENADKIATTYLSFLSEFYFLRNLLESDFPEIKNLVIEQLEQLIREWKREI